MSINRVILEGNVGRDPIVHYFNSGNVKASFPLATSSSYTSQTGESVTSTEWHNVIFWRSLATLVEKDVKKGSRVFVTGSIRTRQYTDKDGNQKYITEIVGDSIVVYNNRPDYTQGHAQNERPNNNQQYYNNSSNISSQKDISAPSEPFFENMPQANIEDDDLPF